jgi:hypothetical protein
MRTLILYVFHQECDNLRLFIERGLLDATDKQFIFIYNDPNYNSSDENSLPASLHDNWSFLFSQPNIHLLVRPNIGQDFQGWNSGLFLSRKTLDHKIIYETEIAIDSDYLYRYFDKFIFINSTVAGPYIPSYVESDWADCFTSKLSDQVKIVGITTNFMVHNHHPSITEAIRQTYGIIHDDSTHMQSMIFGLDQVGLQVLIKYGLFSSGKIFPPDKLIIIILCEIGMSMILRYEGYSMFSLMKSQGLIPAARRDMTDNFWNRPIPFPLCELMFVKTMSYIRYIEKERYDKAK